MYIHESYLFNRITYRLINEHKFDVIYINPEQTEIFLEKKIKGSTHLVRLFQHQFDWKNHLKLDIERTIKNVNQLKHLVLGTNVQIHNIYIATHEPVDDWEDLKKTIPIKNRKFTSITTYYLDESNRQQEANRLFNALSLVYKEIDFPEEELETERLSNYLKTMIVGEYQTHKQEAQKLFKNGKPRITYLLLVVNIIFYLWIEFNGGSNSPETLIEYGAKYNPAIMNGEWWRIISSMFIHIGILHLAMNMFALYYVGATVEQMYGNSRFVIIYFLAGIFGGITSFAMNPNLAAGASGALFGLFGSLLFFGINYRRVFFQTMGWNIIMVIIFNIVFGLSIPQIDNGAHLGGLLGGFIASAVVYFPNKNKIAIQVIAAFTYIALLIGLIFYGVNNTTVQMDETIQLQYTQDLINEEEYKEVIDVVTNAVEYADKYQGELLFLRSFAYIKTGDSEKAKIDLKQVLDIKPELPEAHYNMALLYLDSGDTKKALTHIKQALALKPNNKDFIKLHQRLVEEPS